MPDGRPIAIQKTDFSTIYTEPDPRGYLRALLPLDYQVCQNAMPTVEAVLAALPTGAADPTILDVCCSYGFNAALLRCEVTLAEMGARYAESTADVPAAPALDDSRSFYASRLRHPERTVLGLDTSAPALEYAVRAGLHADGWAEDLERSDPTPALRAGLGEVDVIVCTGGVGYVGAATFRRLLEAHPAPERLWLVSFVLRMYDYAEIAAALDTFGLRTEHLPAVSIRQRRFSDDEERASALAGVRARGLDPAGKEDDGWYYADLYLSRPAGADLPGLLG